MSLDFDALVLGPNYTTFGVTAVLTLLASAAKDVRVIDNTRGVAVQIDNNTGVSSIKPAVTIRASDLGDVEPKGGTLVLNGTTWNIEGSSPVIGPMGIGTGERNLFLAEADL